MISNNEKNGNAFESKIENILTLRKQKNKIEFNKKRFKNNYDDDIENFDMLSMDKLKESFIKFKEIFNLNELFMNLTQSYSIEIDENYYKLLIENNFDISSITKVFVQKDVYFHQLSKNIKIEDFYNSLKLIKDIVNSRYLLSSMIENLGQITPFLFYLLNFYIKEFNFYTCNLKSQPSFISLSEQSCNNKDLIDINNKFNSVMINLLEAEKNNYDIPSSINKINKLYETIINIFSLNAEIINDTNDNGMNCESYKSVCIIAGNDCSWYVISILNSCFEEYKYTIDNQQNIDIIFFYVDIISCSLCCLGNMLSDNDDFNSFFFSKYPHYLLIESMTNIINHLPDPCSQVIEEILYVVHSMNYRKPIDIKNNIFFMYYADFYKEIFERLEHRDNMNDKTIKEFVKHFKFMLTNQITKNINENFSDNIFNLKFYSIIGKILHYFVNNKIVNEDSKDFIYILKIFNKLMINGDKQEHYVFYFSDNSYDESCCDNSDHISYNLLEFCKISFQHFIKCSQELKSYDEYLKKSMIKNNEKSKILTSNYLVSIENLKNFWDFIKDLIHNYANFKSIKSFVKNSDLLENMGFQLFCEDSITFYILKAFEKISSCNSTELKTYIFSKRYYEIFISDRMLDHIKIKNNDYIKKILCWGKFVYNNLELSKSQLKFTNIFKEDLIKYSLQDYIIDIKNDLELPETVHNFYSKIIYDYLYEFEERIM